MSDEREARVPASSTGQVGARAADAAVPLNDVMIAMDVVDTLRHDERLVDLELNETDRRQALIERLREIYSGQGIEVPDRILEEGVRALQEDRFVYKPPPDTISTRLARIYVTRAQWGRLVIGGMIGLLALIVAYLAFFEWPRQRANQAIRIEMTETLPREVDQLAASVAGEAKVPAIAARARELSISAKNAATAGDRDAARSARDRLATLLKDLRAEYAIRVVNRRGELTGLWRIPKANPNAYNYYLVVEAVGADGKPIPQSILNEETGRRETVETWAVRVPREVLTRVEADKRDDGIIQQAEVGRKVRGETERAWSIQIDGGMLTRW